MYYETYKMLMKETEDHTNRWNDICFGIGRINIVKITILFNTIDRVNVICIKSPMAGTKNFKICMETQKTEQSKKS